MRQIASNNNLANEITESAKDFVKYQEKVINSSCQKPKENNYSSLEQIFNMFKCKAAVIDGNGLGTGLIDYLVKDQVDPDTNEMLWNFGVINDEIDQNTGKYRYRQ